MAHISIVVPVYRAEGCLDELYRRLRDSLSTITEDFEIILVEDCGGDRSWEIIQKLAKADTRVRGFQFSRNFGQHYGITAGLDHATGDWAVVMDCDLQDRPEDIPALYRKAQEGHDVVLARRRGRRQHGFLKRLSSMLFYRVFTYLADFELSYEIGNFRIMSKKVVENFCRMREEMRFFGGLMNWMGFPAVSVDVTHASRADGKSAYTVRKLLSLAANTIIAYSDKPLRLAVKVGFCVTAFAFAYGTYVAYLALFRGVPISGWSSLIVSMYFLSGIIIGTLGIVGIYLGKIFDQTKQRPLYIIHRSTQADLAGRVRSSDVR